MASDMNRRLNQRRLYFIKKNRNPSADQILNEELTSIPASSTNDGKPFEVEPREGIIWLTLWPVNVDYIWNGPFRDVCKHCHVAWRDKDKLVTYFKNKERVLPTEQKNTIIYSGSIEDTVFMPIKVIILFVLCLSSIPIQLLVSLLF